MKAAPETGYDGVVRGFLTTFQNAPLEAHHLKRSHMGIKEDLHIDQEREKVFISNHPSLYNDPCVLELMKHILNDKNMLFPWLWNISVF